MEKKLQITHVDFAWHKLVFLSLAYKAFSKSTIVLCILALTFQIKGTAQQWHYYKELPVNVVPKAVASNNAGTIFMLTTDNKIFYKTLEGSWTNITYWGLVSAESISADNTTGRVYVGTSYQGLLYSSNLGASWASNWLVTNPVTGHHEGYGCFAQTANSNLFFAGHFGKPQITVFTGQGTSGTVKTISSNPNASPSALYYTANAKLLVGNHLGIWLSQDNGNSFSQTNHNSGHVFCFTQDANGRVYALNRNIATQEITLLYSDDYISWDTMEVPGVGENYTTIFYNSSSQELWLGSNLGIYSMPVNSNVWENKNLNNTIHSVRQIISDNNNGIYNFSIDNVAQKLTGSGSGWLGTNQGLSGAIDDMVFSNENTLFTYNNFFSPKVSILGTQLQNWSGVILGSAMNGVRNLFIASDGMVFANTHNKLYRLENNGPTFTEFNPPQEFSTQTSGGISLFKKGLQAGIFINHSFIPQKIFGSYDNGENWQVISDIAGPGVFSTFSDFSQDANGRFYCILSGGTFKVYTSLTGETWDLIPFNYNDFSFSFAYSQIECFGTRTFITDSKNVFEIITNGGVSSIVAINTPFLDNDNPMADFKYTSTGNFIINTYINGVYQSVNNAGTWENIGFPITSTTDNSPLENIEQYDTMPFISMKEGNSQGIASGIYYYLDESLSSKDFKVNDRIKLFPNPAISTLYIKSIEDIQSIYIFDSTGRRILSSQHNEGRIDVSNLDEGLYIIMVNTIAGNSYKEKFLKK